MNTADSSPIIFYYYFDLADTEAFCKLLRRRFVESGHDRAIEFRNWNCYNEPPGRDGDVYCCDHFVDEEHRLGTIDDGLGVLAESGRQHAFGSAKRDTLPEQCRVCPYLVCCGGGCPKDRVDGVNILCDGLREFFRRSESQLKTLGSLRRRGVSPKECDAALRAIREKMWQGVGRNDPCPCGSGKKAKKCCWDKRP